MNGTHHMLLLSSARVTLISCHADVRRLRTKEIEAELKEADQIVRISMIVAWMCDAYFHTADKGGRYTSAFSFVLCMQLRRMDMEARSFSQDKSQQLMRKVKEYKADLKKITDDSKQAQGSAAG